MNATAERRLAGMLPHGAQVEPTIEPALVVPSACCSACGRGDMGTAIIVSNEVYRRDDKPLGFAFCSSCSSRIGAAAR